MRLMLSSFMALSFMACGPAQIEQSMPEVVDLPHTSVKWQSIGNCWLYAVFGWVESMQLIHNQESRHHNWSESYLTYRHWQEQLLTQRGQSEINTGGSWYTSLRLIKKYGMMHEGDFIPNEAELAKSNIQLKAKNYINDSLTNGLLRFDRSPQTIIAELNRAFGVQIRLLENKVVSAKNITVKNIKTNKVTTLWDEASAWTEVNWPREMAARPARIPAAPPTHSQERSALLYRVKRAMNDGHPVIMSFFVDFNALTSKGEFSLQELQKRGLGSQGYHMVVLEDYVVRGTHPVTKQPFFIGEGNVPQDQKDLALHHGNILYFVAKNSWGGSERRDRPSYLRLGEAGYAKLNIDYLSAWLPFKDEKTNQIVATTTGLTGFVLPADY